MTYCGPYSQSYNFTHMFDMPDLRGPLPKIIAQPNTLLSTIDNHPDFTKYKYMVDRANLRDTLNSKQSDFTLFIPSDKALSMKVDDDYFVNMDILTARSIVRTSMLNKRISSEILEDSPNAYYYTMDKANRLCVTNISRQTYINGDIKVIYKDIVTNNGIIQVVDGLIIPYIV